MWGGERGAGLLQLKSIDRETCYHRKGDSLVIDPGGIIFPISKITKIKFRNTESLPNDYVRSNFWSLDSQLF